MQYLPSLTQLSNIDSPKLLKNKKATVKDEGYKCFQYTVTVGLNHIKIPNHSGGICNIEKYTDSCDWNNYVTLQNNLGFYCLNC